MSTEQMVAMLNENQCNIEVLYKPGVGTSPAVVGVRIRPWDAKNRGYMILGKGETVNAALREAIGKAQAGRWETLDWAKRPWAVDSRRGAWTIDATEA